MKENADTLRYLETARDDLYNVAHKSRLASVCTNDAKLACDFVTVSDCVYSTCSQLRKCIVKYRELLLNSNDER